MSLPTAVFSQVESWVATDGPATPLPGQGNTWRRLEILAELAGRDLSVARLAEGHLDAVAILDEFGGKAGPGVYGVWAAHRPGELVASRARSGWCLKGSKPFCSGAGLLARALVVADAPDGVRLFDVDVADAEVVEGTWPAVGMAGSASYRVSWSGEPIRATQAVGGPGSYTGRVGFWWGAVGVAACWWGGARSLLRVVGHHLAGGTPGDVELAELGVGWTKLEAAGAVLRWAAVRIDACDGQDMADAQRTALIVRQVVHDACVDVLAVASSAGGARPICLEPDQSRRSADLYAYLAQHHRGRDAAALGRIVVGEL